MLQPHETVADGLYRLVKWQEDGNPVFPSKDTVVEIKTGRIINLSTGRSWPLNNIGAERSLFGPLANPYDNTRLKHLPRIDLARNVRSEPPIQVVGSTRQPRLIA